MRPSIAGFVLVVAPCASAFSVVRPTPPAYLDAGWWTAVASAPDMPVVLDESVDAVLDEAAERAWSDECFWVSGEPEACEIPCEEEEQCEATPMGIMEPPDMVSGACARVHDVLVPASTPDPHPPPPLTVRSLRRPPRQISWRLRRWMCWNRKSGLCRRTGAGSATQGWRSRRPPTTR